MVKSANVDSWSNSSLSCGHHYCAKSSQTSQRLPLRCLVVPVIPNQLYKYVLFSRYLNGPNKIFSILISFPFSIKEYLAKLHYTQNISSKIGYSLGQKLLIWQSECIVNVIFLDTDIYIEYYNANFPPKVWSQF